MRRDRWWAWASRHGFGLGLGPVEINVYLNPPGDRPDEQWLRTFGPAPDARCTCVEQPVPPHDRSCPQHQ